MFIQYQIKIKTKENGSKIEIEIIDFEVNPYVEITGICNCGILYYTPEPLNAERNQFKVTIETPVNTNCETSFTLDNNSFTLEEKIKVVSRSKSVPSEILNHTIDDLIVFYNGSRDPSKRINYIRRCS